MCYVGIESIVKKRNDEAIYMREIGYGECGS